MQDPVATAQAEFQIPYGLELFFCADEQSVFVDMESFAWHWRNSRADEREVLAPLEQMALYTTRDAAAAYADESKLVQLGSFWVSRDWDDVPPLNAQPQTIELEDAA